MPDLAAWCAAGGVYCIAGLRGGYEYGEAWHQAGRRANKQHVFDDFHAAADWLVAQGYTSRERMAVYGRSNGGLLVGVALTQRPDLAAAVWCGVPLLDMIRFPRFLIARLWTDEYGDPDVADEFAWLHAYSPYHHVHEGTAYPAVLFTTAEGDSRVDPCHARKMAALLTAAGSNQGERPILLHQEGRAGHGVGKPVSMSVNELADALTFFSWQLGVDLLEADRVSAAAGRGAAGALDGEVVEPWQAIGHLVGGGRAAGSRSSWRCAHVLDRAGVAEPAGGHHQAEAVRPVVLVIGQWAGGCISDHRPRGAAGRRAAARQGGEHPCHVARRHLPAPARPSASRYSRRRPTMILRAVRVEGVGVGVPSPP